MGSTRNKLKRACRKDQTYDDKINELIDLELKIKAVETNEKKIRNIMRKKQKNLRTLPDLSDGVIHAIADELTHKQIQDYDKMEYLIYESKSRL